MAPYTSPFISSQTGYSGEVNLLDDLVIEQINLYGLDLLYMPRKMLNLDKLLHESTKNAFEVALPMPMYLKTFDGYDNGMELLTKFGVRNADELTMVMSRSLFTTYYKPFLEQYYKSIDGSLNYLEGEIDTRPKEGDLIYFPFDDGIFEIKYVNFDQPFFQLGKGYIFEMNCEKFEYSGETFSTGYADVDNTPAETEYNRTEFIMSEGGYKTFTLNETVRLYNDFTELSTEGLYDIATESSEQLIINDMNNVSTEASLDISTEDGAEITSNVSNEFRLYNDPGFLKGVPYVTATVFEWDKPNKKLTLGLFSNSDPDQKDAITAEIDVNKFSNVLVVGDTSGAQWYSTSASDGPIPFNDSTVIQDEFDIIKIEDPGDVNPFGFV